MTCVLDDCTQRAEARHLCHRHYMQIQRQGRLDEFPRARARYLRQPEPTISPDGMDAAGKSIVRTVYVLVDNFSDVLPEKYLPANPKRPVGTRVTHADGYVVVNTVDGWKLEHRHVMEQRLGRKLARGENVVHRNGRRDDNSPENLELWFVPPTAAGVPVADLLAYAARYHASDMSAAPSRPAAASSAPAPDAPTAPSAR